MNAWMHAPINNGMNACVYNSMHNASVCRGLLESHSYSVVVKALAFSQLPSLAAESERLWKRRQVSWQSFTCETPAFVYT